MSIKNEFEPLVDWKEDLFCGVVFVVGMFLLLGFSGELHLWPFK